MIKTLVINPPFLEPHRPPISCAIIGEIARLEGHEVHVHDINIELYRHVGSAKFADIQTDYLFVSKNNTELENFVCGQLPPEKLSQYQYILISCFSSWEYPLTELIAKFCKQHTLANVVVGGPGISNKIDYLLENKIVDYTVSGEGEVALRELFRGNTDYPGINYNPPVQIDDIESLPLPNYDFFDLSKYAWLLDSPDVFIYGSRGCVRRCTFCDVGKYWPKFRYRSGQSIANEMISNYEKYGVKNFYFADSLLNGNLKEFRAFLDILSNYGPAKDFQWGGYAIVRPKGQHPAELFDQIQAAGGQLFSVGIETGVDRIRHEMKKNFTNDDIDWHLEQSQRIGLQNNFLLIASWYSETLNEHNEYLKMFARWQNYAVDGTIASVTISPPLTVLEDTPLEDLLGTELMFTNTDIPGNIMKRINWISLSNPSLTFKERYRRTLAITEEAIQYNWNLNNTHLRLNEIKKVLANYLDYKSKK